MWKTEYPGKIVFLPFLPAREQLSRHGDFTAVLFPRRHSSYGELIPEPLAAFDIDITSYLTPLQLTEH